MITRPVQLGYGENILRCPVESESRGVIVTKGQEDDRHEVHDPLLGGIATFRGDGHLPDHGAGHDDREKIDRESHDMRERIGL